MSSLPLGNLADLTGFSPANFEDAEDTRPIQVQLDPTGTGTLVPYSTLVRNALQRQTVEIKDKTVSPSPTPGNWKRRLREFMSEKNEDLVNVLRKPTTNQSPLQRADGFLQKFGRQDFQANHPSLQYIFLDASGTSYMPALEAEIKQIGPSSPREILDQVRWVYDNYRQAGEECMKHENALRVKLDILDKTYQKIIGFCELPINEDSEKLAESIEVYIKKLMEENTIEKDYKATVEAYRKFASFRELIQLFRFVELQDKEPLCSICLNESVAFVLTPCGHTLCGTCLKRQASLCYMCRTHVKDKVKIYFG
jgi:hypothetical protein